MKTFLAAGLAAIAATVAFAPAAQARDCNKILQSNCEGASCDAQKQRYRACVAAEQRRKNANPSVGERKSRDTTGAGRTNRRINNSSRDGG